MQTNINQTRNNLMIKHGLPLPEAKIMSDRPIDPPVGRVDFWQGWAMGLFRGNIISLGGPICHGEIIFLSQVLHICNVIGEILRKKLDERQDIFDGRFGERFVDSLVEAPRDTMKQTVAK
jgi:hypothetical protein